MSEKSDTIRELNDKFRTSMTGGRVLCTAGVDALSETIKNAVIEKVRTFTAFEEGDDPYREHDFGTFTVPINRGGTISEEQFFFKIDYYDKAMEMGSDDPADPDKTTRVLTIMLSEEY